ncbi:MAG: hypothetical protein PHF57_05875 [Methanoregula sp.]|nr:hypothetical protein [Methanoregula sp.]
MPARYRLLLAGSVKRGVQYTKRSSKRGSSRRYDCQLPGARHCLPIIDKELEK